MPPAGVPRTVWQARAARGEDLRACAAVGRRPAPRRRAAGLRARPRRPPGGSAMTKNAMWACCSAAVLGALAAIDARPVGLQPGDVGAPGNDVGLAGQLPGPRTSG